MLLSVSIVVMFWIGIYSLVQLCIVGRYAQIMLTKHELQLDSAALPKAAVVLALRGPDPSLEDNIRALLDQDYPNYSIFIVVDHIEDPTWPIMCRLRDRSPSQIYLSVLETPSSICSLKCSALADTIEKLDASYEVVAFLDGDTTAHRHWLRDLTAPLADPRIGVTTGARWYVPEDASWGSMTRYFWNAGAVVQVWLNGAIWAGSMALRQDVLRRTGIIQAWRRSLSDDAAVVRQLRRHAYKICFVPSIMPVNREKISLSNFMQWAERQTIIARSWDRQWGMVVLHAVNLAICLLAPIGLGAAALLTLNTHAFDFALLSAAVYWLATLVSIIGLELSARKILASHNLETRWLSGTIAIRCFPSLLLAHLVVLRATVGAFFRKRIIWRGIEYEALGAEKCRMTAYQIFNQTSLEQPKESVL